MVGLAEENECLRGENEELVRNRALTEAHVACLQGLNQQFVREVEGRAAEDSAVILALDRRDRVNRVRNLVHM
jgi:hypothetical protein